MSQADSPDLGVRMGAALASALERSGGADAGATAVLVGSDLPDLASHHIRAALDALGEGAAPTSDAVVGPAADGGYYLIGVRAAATAWPRLLEGIPWSGPLVRGATEAAATKAGLALATDEILPVLRDLDTASDVSAWLSEASRGHPLWPALAEAMREAEIEPGPLR